MLEAFNLATHYKVALDALNPDRNRTSGGFRFALLVALFGATALLSAQSQQAVVQGQVTFQFFRTRTTQAAVRSAPEIDVTGAFTGGEPFR